jgi:hypothetical protein
MNDYFLVVRVLPFDYFLVVCAPVRLLLEGCSLECTAFILPTSTNDRLFQAAQHIDCQEWHHRCLQHWSYLWVYPDALIFICYVLYVSIQIKHEHEQPLCCHNIVHSQ